jgi:sugar phosphate isomerase/epimerase
MGKLEAQAMRFGCCGSTVTRAADGTGVDAVEVLRAAGYDYIELSLAHMMALPEADFRALVERSGLRCESCNNFIPAHVRPTGEQVDWKLVQDYVAAALARAGDVLRHVHLARIEGRTFPTTSDAGLETFMRQLKAIDYRGRVSVEAYTDDLRADAAAALNYLRTLAG